MASGYTRDAILPVSCWIESDKFLDETQKVISSIG
jgi:hypothetical protein